MSTSLASWAMAQPLTKGTKSVLMVYATLAYNGPGPRRNTCFPGIERVGELAGLKERAVRNAKKKLIELGLIKSDRDGRGGQTPLITVYPDRGLPIERIRARSKLRRQEKSAGREPPPITVEMVAESERRRLAGDPNYQLTEYGLPENDPRLVSVTAAPAPDDILEAWGGALLEAPAPVEPISEPAPQAIAAEAETSSVEDAAGVEKCRSNRHFRSSNRHFWGGILIRDAVHKLTAVQKSLPLDGTPDRFPLGVVESSEVANVKSKTKGEAKLRVAGRHMPALFFELLNRCRDDRAITGSKLKQLLDAVHEHRAKRGSYFYPPFCELGPSGLRLSPTQIDEVRERIRANYLSALGDLPLENVTVEAGVICDLELFPTPPAPEAFAALVRWRMGGR